MALLASDKKPKYVKRRSLSSVEVLPRRSLKMSSSRHSSCDFSSPGTDLNILGPVIERNSSPAFPFATLVHQISYRGEEKDALLRELHPSSFQNVWPYPPLSPPSAVSSPTRRSLPPMRPDLIAINHMPRIKYTAKLMQDLQHSDMWDVAGTVFVKHSGVRSLILQMAKPLTIKDLELLTRWTRARLKTSKPVVTLASQVQILEFNNLKQNRIRKKSGGRRKASTRSTSKNPKSRKERRQDMSRTGKGKQHKNSIDSSASTKSHISSIGRSSQTRHKSSVGSCSSTQSQSDDQSQSHSEQEPPTSTSVRTDDRKVSSIRTTIMPRSASEKNRKSDNEKNFYKSRELSYPPVGYSVYGMSMRSTTGYPNYLESSGSARETNLELVRRNSDRSSKESFLPEGLALKGLISSHHPQSAGMHYPDSPSLFPSGPIHRQQSAPNIFHHNNWHNWNQRPVNWNHPKTESLNSPRQHNVHVWTNHALPSRFYKDKYLADRRRAQSARPRRAGNEHVKCLFLAIEGVLTTTEEGPNLPRHIQDMTSKLALKLCLLKHIICLTGCKLVLISVARLDPSLVEFINNIFKSWAIEPFYSRTPSLHSDKVLPAVQRANEVKTWLTSQNNVRSWCVVDSMDLGALDDGKKRTVMLDGRKGLTREKARTMLEILGVEQDLYR